MNNLLIKSLNPLNPVKVSLTQIHRHLNRVAQQGHKSTDIPQPDNGPETVFETPHPGQADQPYDEPVPIHKAAPERLDFDPLEKPFGQDDFMTIPSGSDQVGPTWTAKAEALAEEMEDADEPPVGHGNSPNNTPITSPLQQADVATGSQVTSNRTLK